MKKKNGFTLVELLVVIALMLSILGIRQIAVVINKMDLVDYDEAVFEQVKEEYLQFHLTPMSIQQYTASTLIISILQTVL